MNENIDCWGVNYHGQTDTQLHFNKYQHLESHLGYADESLTVDDVANTQLLLVDKLSLGTTHSCALMKVKSN